MRCRSLLSRLFVLMMMFLIWQLLLILRTVNELFIGIDKTSYKSQLNETIPSLIHQMWKTTDLSSYPINHSHWQWKEIYPEYQIKLWTDEKIDELLSRKEYQYLSSVYHSYPYAIQRADLARLLILHAEGGIYADLDVYPNERNSDVLRFKNASLIIARSSSDLCLVNHFLLAEKHSHLLEDILRKMFRKSFLERIYLLPYLEVFSTGSVFLTSFLRKRMRLISPEDDRLIILSKEELNKYIGHDAGRSWHLIDGYLLNQIDANPKRIIPFLFLFLLLLLCIIKFFKSK